VKLAFLEACTTFCFRWFCQY